MTMRLKLLKALFTLGAAVIFPASLAAQPFLAFPLPGTSISVYHGWYYNDLYNDTSYHGAVDYIVPRNTPILAAADGIAMTSSQPSDPTKDTYGAFVLVKHANGFSSLYAHLSSAASN